MAPSRPSILFVTSDLNRGGAETALLELAGGLTARSWRCSVISLSATGSMKRDFETLGIPVELLALKSRPHRLARAVSIVRRTRPDLIQGWMYHGNLLATILSRALGAPARLCWAVRHTLNHIEGERLSTRFAIRWGRCWSGLPAAVVYNSWRSMGTHHAYGYRAGRDRVIPNGFDQERFKPRAGAQESFLRERGLPSDAFLIGHIGRYHPAKDHVTFLRAASIVARHVPRAHFVMAGREVSPQNRELLAALFANGIAERCSLLGECTAVPELMAALDAGCVSSNTEAFPNVLGEMMSSGVPCVSTAVGDADRILGDTGASVPIGDFKALADELIKLAALPPEELAARGDAARARIGDNFSREAFIRSFGDLYGALLSEQA